MEWIAVKHKLRKILGLSSPEIWQASRKKWIVAQEETAITPPSLCVCDPFERITSLGTSTSIERERRRVYGGSVDHCAVELHEFEDAVLFDGSVYCGHAQWRVFPRQTYGISITAPTTFEDALLASSYDGNHFFGHWLTEDCSLGLLAEDLNSNAIVVDRPRYHHESQFNDVLQITTEHTQYAICEKLKIVKGQYTGSSWKDNQIKRLRKRIRHAIKGNAPIGAYIMRGSVGTIRSIVNEELIIEYLAQLGFEIIDPSMSTVPEIFSRIIDAPIIIGIEGSQLSHGLLALREQGVLIALHGQNRFKNPFLDYTAGLDMRYGFIVGTGSSDTGFRINLDELSALLDLAYKEVGHSHSST